MKAFKGQYNNYRFTALTTTNVNMKHLYCSIERACNCVEHCIVDTHITLSDQSSRDNPGDVTTIESSHILQVQLNSSCIC